MGRRKSSSQGKSEGAMVKLKGRAKEAASAVTDDERTKSEGRVNQTSGPS